MAVIRVCSFLPISLILSRTNLKELVDSIKYGLNQLNQDLILTKRFLEYAKARYEGVYREELLTEEEDEKVMDELDAMRE